MLQPRGGLQDTYGEEESVVVFPEQLDGRLRHLHQARRAARALVSQVLVRCVTVPEQTCSQNQDHQHVVN